MGPACTCLSGTLPTKNIHTVIQDIYQLIKTRGWFTSELEEDHARRVAQRLRAHWAEQTEKPTLRLSQMGLRCPCALWHSIHTPELREPLPPWAEVKYAFGHDIEALAITLCKAAGHTVEGEQDVVVVDGIAGHRDAVVDGCIVDFKSSSSRGMEKFKKGSQSSLDQRDDFGYLEQVDGYVVGSLTDPLVRVKDRGYLFAIDKTLGHCNLYEHYTRETHIRQRIADSKSIIALDRPPRCTCETVPHGKSGNIALGTVASYNPFKYCCKPQLRTFLYADKPVYLVHIERLPDVAEITREGQIILN
jgi:hypothetical protein